MGFRIGSFNLNVFSQNTTRKDGKDVDIIAKILLENEYDIVAIQEIYHKEALIELMEKISGQYVSVCEKDRLKRNYSTDVSKKSNRTNDIYGYRTKHWEGRWAQPNSYYGGRVQEGYAFIWNRNRIKLVTNTKDEVFEPRIADEYANEIVRPPFIARFMPINGRYEFRLINSHIAYGVPSSVQKEYDDEKEVDIKDCVWRQKELSVLLRKIFLTYCEEIYDKTGHYKNARYLVPYTFMLGDYNLNLNNSLGKSSAKFILSDEDIIIQSKGELRLVSVNNELTTMRNRPKDPEKERDLRNNPSINAHLSNNYDHFSYDYNIFYNHNIMTPDVGVIRAFEKYRDVETETDSMYDLYREKVSDHLPIYMDIDIQKRMY